MALQDWLSADMLTNQEIISSPSPFSEFLPVKFMGIGTMVFKLFRVKNDKKWLQNISSTWDNIYVTEKLFGKSWIYQKIR